MGDREISFEEPPLGMCPSCSGKLLIVLRDLSDLQCSDPQCVQSHGPMYIHARCHRGTRTSIRHENNVTTVRCSVCGEVAGRFATTAPAVDLPEIPTWSYYDGHGHLVIETPGFAIPLATLDVLERVPDPARGTES